MLIERIFFIAFLLFPLNLVCAQDISEELHIEFEKRLAIILDKLEVYFINKVSTITPKELPSSKGFLNDYNETILFAENISDFIFTNRDAVHDILDHDINENLVELLTATKITPIKKKFEELITSYTGKTFGFLIFWERLVNPIKEIITTNNKLTNYDLSEMKDFIKADLMLLQTVIKAILKIPQEFLRPENGTYWTLERIFIQDKISSFYFPKNNEEVLKLTSPLSNRDFSFGILISDFFTHSFRNKESSPREGGNKSAHRLLLDILSDKPLESILTNAFDNDEKKESERDSALKSSILNNILINTSQKIKDFENITESSLRSSHRGFKEQTFGLQSENNLSTLKKIRRNKISVQHPIISKKSIAYVKNLTLDKNEGFIYGNSLENQNSKIGPKIDKYEPKLHIKDSKRSKSKPKYYIRTANENVRTSCDSEANNYKIVNYWASSKKTEKKNSIESDLNKLDQIMIGRNKEIRGPSINEFPEPTNIQNTITECSPIASEEEVLKGHKINVLDEKNDIAGNEKVENVPSLENINVGFKPTFPIKNENCLLNVAQKDSKTGKIKVNLKRRPANPSKSNYREASSKIEVSMVKQVNQRSKKLIPTSLGKERQANNRDLKKVYKTSPLKQMEKRISSEPKKGEKQTSDKVLNKTDDYALFGSQKRAGSNSVKRNTCNNKMTDISYKKEENNIRIKYPNRNEESQQKQRRAFEKYFSSLKNEHRKRNNSDLINGKNRKPSEENSSSYLSNKDQKKESSTFKDEGRSTSFYTFLPTSYSQKSLNKASTRYLTLDERE